jgi:hypothetical protein
MSDKNQMHRYDAEVMAMPPLKLVLGDVPNPDPVGRRKGQNMKRPSPDMEMTVLKLISSLKEQAR